MIDSFYVDATAPAPAHYARYVFAGFSGHLVHPRTAKHELIMVRHTAQVAPWSDADVHLHEESEEIYILLEGELRFFVAGATLDLKARELLLVKPGVPHSLLHGAGLIEHFGLRTPAGWDRLGLDGVPAELPSPWDSERELGGTWGFRIPLDEPRNHNCWLLGPGGARYHSPHVALAYLNLPTQEAANAGFGAHHPLHLHREAREYYLVLAGAKALLIEDEEVIVRAGELVEVFPGARHRLLGWQAPYRGFTFRAPLLDDKVDF